MTGEKIKSTDFILIFVTFAGVTLILLGIESNKPELKDLPDPTTISR